MKIFVSYSRRDASDYAKRIHNHLRDVNHIRHDVFTDVNNIEIGTVWSDSIKDNISSCDLFIVVLTHAALTSSEVEKEVLQAQRENKRIIPCKDGILQLRSVEYTSSKWGLEKIQGIEFGSIDELARELYLRIERIQGGGDKGH